MSGWEVQRARRLAILVCLDWTLAILYTALLVGLFFLLAY